MSWQEDEIRKREKQELTEAQKKVQLSVTKEKVQQLWNKIVEMNASLPPTLQLEVRGNAITNRGAFSGGLELKDNGMIAENGWRWYLSWDDESDAFFVGEKTTHSCGKKDITPACRQISEDVKRKWDSLLGKSDDIFEYRQFYIEDNDIEHVLKNMVLGKQPLYIYGSTLGNEPVVNIDGDDVYVRALQFFEGSLSSVPEFEESVYKTTFFSASTRFIYWQCIFVPTKPLPYDKQLTIEATYLFEGEWLDSVSVDVPVFAGSDSSFSWFRHPRGWEEAGKWPKGRYTVKLGFEGGTMIERSFEVT